MMWPIIAPSFSGEATKDNHSASYAGFKVVTATGEVSGSDFHSVVAFLSSISAPPSISPSSDVAALCSLTFVGFLFFMYSCPSKFTVGRRSGFLFFASPPNKLLKFPTLQNPSPRKASHPILYSNGLVLVNKGEWAAEADAFRAHDGGLPRPPRRLEHPLPAHDGERHLYSPTAAPPRCSLDIINEEHASSTTVCSDDG
ncbi:hypothetical protein Sjap_006534 [Stephania japonica]|uniref:Uncharacterized protein n=1 Tax=Stephania japonica TaxID=461633 RepID=A0AAP0K657_9MAGN